MASEDSLTFGNAAERYLAYAKSALGLSEDTLRTYANRLRRFEYWLEHGGNLPTMPRRNQYTNEKYPITGTAPLSLFTVEVLERYRDAADERGFRPRSKLAVFQPLRSLGDYLVERGILKTNPAHGVKLPKKDAPTQHLISNDEAQAVYEACLLIHDERERLRARALIGMLVFTGLRRAELINLRVSDVRLGGSDAFVVVRRGKGNKRRQIFLFSEYVPEIENWLNERAKIGCRHDYLFAQNLDKRIGKQGLTIQLARAVDLAGLPAGTKVRPHSIRHNTATRLLEAGEDLETIREWLGHSSILTTQLYLHGNEKKMRAAARSAGFGPSDRKPQLDTDAGEGKGRQ